jgi:hypothetical protein
LIFFDISEFSCFRRAAGSRRTGGRITGVYRRSRKTREKPLFSRERGFFPSATLREFDGFWGFEKGHIAFFRGFRGLFRRIFTAIFPRSRKHAFGAVCCCRFMIFVVRRWSPVLVSFNRIAETARRG